MLVFRFQVVFHGGPPKIPCRKIRVFRKIRDLQVGRRQILLKRSLRAWYFAQKKIPTANTKNPLGFSGVRGGGGVCVCGFVVFLFKYRVFGFPTKQKNSHKLESPSFFFRKKQKQNKTPPPPRWKKTRKQKNTKWRTLERCSTWKREACHWFVVDPPTTWQETTLALKICSA